MMDHSGDHSDENSSSQTLSTEPVRFRQLQNPSDGDQTTSSSASQSTHIKEKESDVEKGLSSGEDVDEPAATEKTKAKKENQKTAVMQEKKQQDPNLVGWEGMVSFPSGQCRSTRSKNTSQVPTTLKIPRIGQKAKNTLSRSSTPS